MKIFACVLMAVFTAAPVSAAGKTTIEAVYDISIAGWALAHAELKTEINDGRYQADLFMRPKGVARIVTAVRTYVYADGRISRGKVQPSRYKVRAEETDKPVAVDMGMNKGTVTKLAARPPLKKRPGRVAVTNAHKRNIVDPLSAGFLPSRAADASDACKNTLEIYDGWTRYDVRLYLKTTTRVQTKGYSGPAAVCGARWIPVSGHRPAKKEVQYLANNKALEMTVVPVPGKDVAIPYGVEIGTPNGTIKIVPSKLVISGPGA